MRYDKSGIKTIGGIISYMLLLGAFIISGSPVISAVFVCFWVLFWLYSIYGKIQCLRNPSPNEMRYPIQNDDSVQMASISLGIIILGNSFIGYLKMVELSSTPFIGALVAIIILVNASIFIPNGKLTLEQGKIWLKGKGNELLMTDMQLIYLESEKLVIRGTDNQSIIDKEARFNEKWASKVEAFLIKKLDAQKIDIQNRVVGGEGVL